MNLDERAALGGNLILPTLQGLRKEVKAKVGMQITDDDLLFATIWAAVRYSVATTGGPAAIERLRDVLDEIEATGAFGLR